ncbi:hypothetical protein [Dysgonomonas alginatilytica]|nr:hypothetical protein [Dysgonomonas alginatilytica]
MKDKYNLNDQVVSAIKGSIPKNGNVINELMEVLPIGKEAVYRRLRGEVPFTFEEIAKLSLQMGFSLDAIIGVKNQERAVFHLNMLDIDNLIEDYCLKLGEYIHFFRKMRDQKQLKARFAFNTLPYSFYLPFENLAKFRLYRWFYQANNMQSYVSFSELNITQEVLDMQVAFIEESRSIQKAVFILDRDIFNSIIKDINYFFKLNLIMPEELEQLKSDLFELINELETISISGMYKTGTKVSIYLANVDLEASHSHIESDIVGYSHLRVLAVNGLDSQNSKVSDAQRDWIESLKRCSTLITQSGEVDRFAFFRKQRVAVSNIGRD